MAACGFAHMDIKPDNLLVAAGRGGVEGEIQILLGDFGTLIPLTEASETCFNGNMVRLVLLFGVDWEFKWHAVVRLGGWLIDSISDHALCS